MCGRLSRNHQHEHDKAGRLRASLTNSNQNWNQVQSSLNCGTLDLDVVHGSSTSNSHINTSNTVLPPLTGKEMQMAYRIVATYFDPTDNEHDPRYEIVFNAEIVDGKLNARNAFGYATDEVRGGPLRGQFVKYPFILEPPAAENAPGRLNYGHGRRQNNQQFESIDIFTKTIATGEQFTVGDGEDAWPYRIDSIVELV